MSASVQSVLSHEVVKVSPGEEALFRQNYNRQPFVLEHHLSQHPLLQLPHLTAVAQSFASQHPERLYYTIGNTNLSSGWDYATKRAVPPQEAIDQIQTKNTWLILKGVQILPEYGELLDQILEEIHTVSGREWKKVRQAETSVSSSLHHIKSRPTTWMRIATIFFRSRAPKPCMSLTGPIATW